MIKTLKRSKGIAGFTLMELMIVIAIIIILSGAIVSRVSTSGERAKVGKATAEVEELATACRAYYADTGVWPGNDISVLLSAPNPAPQGLDEYGKAATGDSPSKSPYLEVATGTTLLDPWKKPYQLTITTINGASFLYVISNGPNGNSDGINNSTGKVNPDDIAVLVHRFSPAQVSI
jgi:general secretion pathway protein G